MQEYLIYRINEACITVLLIPVAIVAYEFVKYIIEKRKGEE
jgi:hypothetical protein